MAGISAAPPPSRGRFLAEFPRDLGISPFSLRNSGFAVANSGFSVADFGFSVVDFGFSVADFGFSGNSSVFSRNSWHLSIHPGSNDPKVFATFSFNLWNFSGTGEILGFVGNLRGPKPGTEGGRTRSSNSSGFCDFSGFSDFSGGSAVPRSGDFWDWGIFGVRLGFGVLRRVRGGSWREGRGQIPIFFFFSPGISNPK